MTLRWEACGTPNVFAVDSRGTVVTEDIKDFTLGKWLGAVELRGMELNDLAAVCGMRRV